MKLIFASFLLICCFASVFGGDGCTVEGKSLKVGEKYAPPGKCVEYTCVGKGSLTEVVCPPPDFDITCKLIPQDSKPFPDCCYSYDYEC